MLLAASQEWPTVSVGVVCVLALLIFIGLVWSARRELYIWDQEKRSSESLKDMMAVNNRLTANADVIVLRLTELAQASKDNRRELLDFVREKASDQKQLSLDIEIRLREIIREMEHHRSAGGTSVNVYDGDARQSVNHFSGDHASVAQGQSVNQTKNAG